NKSSNHRHSSLSKRFPIGQGIVLAIASALVFGGMLIAFPYLRELKFARHIEASGGYVHFWYFGPEWIPEEFRSRLSVFNRVACVTSHSTTDANYVDHLLNLSHLEILDFSKSDVVDADLSRLRGMTTVKTLRLDGTGITDSSLEHVS